MWGGGVQFVNGGLQKNINLVSLLQPYWIGIDVQIFKCTRWNKYTRNVIVKKMGILDFYEKKGNHFNLIS